MTPPDEFRRMVNAFGSGWAVASYRNQYDKCTAVVDELAAEKRRTQALVDQLGSYTGKGIGE
jgi:hypothetical protein